MITDLKSRDVLNRRQKERPLKLGMHDIACARYFTIDNSERRYSLRIQEFASECPVYYYSLEGQECIGYASPDRNKIVINVQKHGLRWTSKISLSDIKIFGSKLPSDL
jgi:hypothetical protein